MIFFHYLYVVRKSVFEIDVKIPTLMKESASQLKYRLMMKVYVLHINFIVYKVNTLQLFQHNLILKYKIMSYQV